MTAAAHASSTMETPNGQTRSLTFNRASLGPSNRDSAGQMTVPAVPPTTTRAMALPRCASGCISAATKRDRPAAALPGPISASPPTKPGRLRATIAQAAMAAPTVPIA